MSTEIVNVRKTYTPTKYNHVLDIVQDWQITSIHHVQLAVQHTQCTMSH